jgi:hypothetical protein
MFINGSEMRDFKNFKADDREIAKTVKLMNFTDYADVTPENSFTIDYVPPKGQTEFDFDAVLDGTAVVKVSKFGGGSYQFSDCKCLKVGGESIDGENEMAKTISVFAGSRSDK